MSEADDAKSNLNNQMENDCSRGIFRLVDRILNWNKGNAFACIQKCPVHTSRRCLQPQSNTSPSIQMLVHMYGVSISNAFIIWEELYSDIE